MTKRAHEYCYWCDARATTREHVPPKCLFPKSSKGVDNRRQLLVVPSCPTHNTAKSHDDEYLLCILALSILNNATGQTHANTTVLRALERSGGLRRSVFDRSLLAQVQDMRTGAIYDTQAIRVDVERVSSVLEHIARAIHFKHFNLRWLGKVVIHAEFLLNVGGQHAEDWNARLEAWREKADDLFSSAPLHGANKNVFSYQVIDDPNDLARRAMRFTFYEGTKAVAVFLPGATEDSLDTAIRKTLDR